MTCVRGLRCVDDLVSREKDDVRFYALQDANWNVVALCDIDGEVLERYTYDGFGNRNALMNSGIDFDRAFTGQVYDNETGLLLYRNRFYSTALGRFVQRDPIGYEADDENLYRYVGNTPSTWVDSLGLSRRRWWNVPGRIYDWWNSGGSEVPGQVAGTVGPGAPLAVVAPLAQLLLV